MKHTRWKSKNKWTNEDDVAFFSHFLFVKRDCASRASRLIATCLISPRLLACRINDNKRARPPHFVLQYVIVLVARQL